MSRHDHDAVQTLVRELARVGTLNNDSFGSERQEFYGAMPALCCCADGNHDELTAAVR